jgi:LacI family transcriptional regulator
MPKRAVPATTSNATRNTPGQRPTLKTIAFLTGLGVTTVSKALKDAPDIGKNTKQRVRQVAEQIGYRPNRAGVRLRTGKTNVISLILDTEEEITGLTSNMVRGITEVLADTQYHLVVTPYGGDADRMGPVRYVVETGSADGVILSRTEPDDPRVRYLAESGMPFATHGRTDIGLEHAFHDFDNFAFARDAVNILASLGRRRIALLGPPSNQTYSRHMRDGFMAAVRAHGLETVPIDGVTVDDNIERVESFFWKLMSTEDRPDGLVAGSASSGIGVCVGAERAGLAVGRDLDVVSKQSSFAYLHWLRPELHVIGEDFREAGRDLARSVLGLIAGEPVSRFQRLVYAGVSPELQEIIDRTVDRKKRELT